MVVSIWTPRFIANVYAVPVVIPGSQPQSGYPKVLEVLQVIDDAAQIANAAGVAAIGAVFFAIEAAYASRPALFISASLFALAIVTSAAFLSWMRRASA